MTIGLSRAVGLGAADRHESCACGRAGPFSDPARLEPPISIPAGGFDLGPLAGPSFVSAISLALRFTARYDAELFHDSIEILFFSLHALTPD